MKFLIVGASGYVGGQCYRYLVSKGHEVMGTQFSSGNPSLVTFDLQKERIEGVLGNTFFRGKEKIFGVIFAGISQVERCFSDKEKSYQINVLGTCRLLRDLNARGVTLVYISTSAVYDGLTGYYNEDSPPNPQTVYGKQKLEVENWIQKNVPKALILRLDKALGDTLERRNLLWEWYTLMKQKKPIYCLEQIFSPTYVNDIARAVLVCCEKNMKGEYQIANTEIFTREELVRQFAFALGERCDIHLKTQVELNFKEARPARSSLNSRKFITAAGFSFTSMQEIFHYFKEGIDSQNVEYVVSTGVP